MTLLAHCRRLPAKNLTNEKVISYISAIYLILLYWTTPYAAAERMIFIMAEENYENKGKNETKEKIEHKPKRTAGYVSLSDIITFQAIICVLIGIMFVTLNMLYPDISAQIYYAYERHATEDNAEGFFDFINSRPNPDFKNHD